MISVVFVLAILAASGDAVNLLISKRYDGQHTCSGTPSLVEYDEVNTCFDTGFGISTMNTCDGVFGWAHSASCQGDRVLMNEVGVGCIDESFESDTYAEDRECVDADWYRVKAPFSQDACDANTVVSDSFPRYVTPTDCMDFHFAGYGKIIEVFSNNSIVFSGYGGDETCASTPINQTVQLGICFNDPKSGNRIVIEKVEDVPLNLPPTSSPTRRHNNANDVKGSVVFTAGVMLVAVYGLMM